MSERETDDHALLNIVGERVALGPLRRTLVPLYWRWENDFSTLRTLEIPHPVILEEYEAWFDEKKVPRDTEMVFTVYERATVRPIGITNLMGINYRNQTAEFGIVLGEANARGQGYGTEASRLMLDFAFTGLCLHSVYLRTWEYNRAGQCAFVKAGFRECGRRRESKMMGGKLWDTVYMECLVTEFTSPLLNKVFVPDGDQS